MSDTLDRRGFLRQAAAGAAALAGAAVPPWPALGRLTTAAAGPQRICVIGAGMAGLTTALELIARGHDVTILEARSRPGGRVFTIRGPFADGLYAEGGAMQVYDSHSRVQRYIQQLGLEIDPIRPAPGATLLHVLGHRIQLEPDAPVSWPFAMKADERTLDPHALWEKYVVPVVNEVAAAEASDPTLASMVRYDRMSFSALLRERGASPPAVAIIGAGVAAGLGDGPERVSALDFLREAAHRQARKQSFTIRGGTDRLPRALAAKLGDRIQYGTAVVRIERQPSGVNILAVTGSARRTFAADRVVCAIPFSVLRRVDVSPPFTTEKRAAIAGLQYTSVTRVFVQTRTRFWIAAGLSANASTDLPVMGIYERAINQPGTRGILESYMAGPNARRATALGERDRLAQSLDGMAKVYPQIVDQYEGGVSKSWDDDEWSRGAYAWFEPGQMTSLLPHIASPEGRIHFAGDHASSSPGGMEGAVESAERVVREIESVTG